MNKTALTLSAAAVAATLALAGCSSPSGNSSGGNSMSGMDHSGTAMATATASPTAPASASASASASADVSAHNAADTMFAQMMIPHHRQAIQMSDIMLKKQDLPADVAELAGEIKAAQGPEIETMASWLKGWGEPTEAAAGHDMASMEGMMSDADLAKLDAAQGTEAAKLFLEQMIAHHEGAVKMARAESTDGKNASAVALSQKIVEDQEAEISKMKALLQNL
ncbi:MULTISPECIES: DUF305 domain-containing protein [unclassified Arthrobacter]|uniref:DUF305 domain-containing protein n=1 Tax=unclassified Arthrobacter TaxID=235627 RepID=UPI001C8425F8|nr:DUF305 domain-containing protein [Arthrobacter sp. MAHUQ-56]MBX7444842.1 DUF305 domain-containing protein [Arthrobacter sp. MAHUQ-56]